MSLSSEWVKQIPKEDKEKLKEQIKNSKYIFEVLTRILNRRIEESLDTMRGKG